MTDGWAFLRFFFIFPTLILGGISCLCLFFFIRFQSFRNFVYSKVFWIAWFFPYYTLLLIAYITREWDLLTMYIWGISLPLVYFVRKVFIQSHLNLTSNESSLWIIPMIIFSLCIHSSLYIILTWNTWWY